MDNVIEILLKPDNLPIAAMAVMLVFLLWVWLRQALVNDALIAQGRKDDIADEMRK